MHRWTCLWLCMQACFVPDHVVEDYLDWDGDGEQTDLTPGGTDCNDDDPDVGTHAAEICGDGIDNNCDDEIDDVGEEPLWWRDADGDGFGDPDEPSTQCTAPSGYVADATDCDDRDDLTNRVRPEICGDDRDNDCDERVDEDGVDILWFVDNDGDGYGNSELPADIQCQRPLGRTALDGDCNDDDDAIHPAAADALYDGIDANCDQQDDYDFDQDGYRIAQDHPDVLVPHGDPLHGDCDDRNAAVHPGGIDVWYDGVDGNCDGANDYDQDQDGYASPLGGGEDCDDLDPNVHPEAHDEPYDGIDADCNPANDDDVDGDGILGGPLGTDCDDLDPNNWISCATCADGDGDGAFSLCDAYVTLPEDCSDDNPTIHPAAFDILGDGIDQDCSGADFDLNHPDLVFVSTAGVDTNTCGASTAPCATIQAGVDLAAGRTVVVTEGDYAGFATTVDVHGGLAQDFSGPGGETRVTHSANPELIRVDDAALSNLTVAASGGTLRGVSTGGDSTLHNIVIALSSGTQCTGVGGNGRLAIEALDLDVQCPDAGNANGIVMGTQDANSLLTVVTSSIHVVGDQSSTGIDANGRADVWDTSISSASHTAIAILPTGQLTFHGGEMFANGSDISYGIRAFAPTSVLIAAALVEVTTGRTGSAIRSAAQTDVQLTNVALVFPERALVFDAPDSSALFRHCTATSQTPNATLITGGGVSTLVNSIVDANTLFEDAMSYSLHGVATNAACVLRNGSCAVPPSPVDLCASPLCGSTESVQWELPTFVQGDPFLGPTVDSIAVDAGVDPAPWGTVDADSIGQMRPSGVGWDLGHIEWPASP